MPILLMFALAMPPAEPQTPSKLVTSAFALAQAFDIATTCEALDRGLREGNPVLRLIGVDTCHEIAGVKVLVTVPAVLRVYRQPVVGGGYRPLSKRELVGTWITAGVTTAAGLWNIRQIRKHGRAK